MLPKRNLPNDFKMCFIRLTKSKPSPGQIGEGFFLPIFYQKMAESSPYGV